MKKFLLFLVLFLISASVNAQTYYSDYGKWSKYSKKNISDSELREVEVERRYKWYKNKEEGEYLLYNDGINKYESVNWNNYLETDYSDWNLNKPSELQGRIIENYKNYAVKKVKPIKNIYILNGCFKSETVNLNKIEIYSQNKLVNFTSICGGCTDKYALNNISGFLMIELDDYYYFDDLTIIINPLNKKDINSLKFMITAPILDSDEEQIYYDFIYESSDDNYIKLDVKNFNIVSVEYEEEKIYSELPTISYSDKIREINYYRYKDRLYYFYNNKKEYLEGYFNSYNNYIKDENDYIDYFRYRTRDKLEIGEYIEIESKQKHVEDYINSTVKYQIDGSIDYNKNGIYIIDVKTYFISKTVPVLVNIKENEKNDIVIVEKDSQTLIDSYDKLKKENKQILDDYNNMKDKQNTLINDYNKLLEEKSLLYLDHENLKTEKNNLFLNYQSITNKYNKLLKEKNSDSVESNRCQEELEKAILQNNDNEKKLKLSNQAYDYLNSSLLKIDKTNFELGFEWYLWLLLLIILLIIFIIIILKKRKK